MVRVYSRIVSQKSAHHDVEIDKGVVKEKQ